MNAVRLTLHAKDLPDNLAKLRSAVEARVDGGVVMENQSELVEVVHTLKQVMCIKG